MKSAEDIRIEIEEAHTDSVESQQAVESNVLAGLRNRPGLALIVALILFAAVITLAMPYFRPPTQPSELRLDIVTPSGTDPFSFAISPDGKRLVFVASGDGEPRLWLRPLDATAAQPLAGTNGAAFPFWSPDSRSVGFFAGAKLKRIDIGGGQPQTLADAPLGRGGAWSPDGVILFAAAGGGPLFRISASGGEAVAVTKSVQRVISDRFPQFLPDGRHFLFFSTGSAPVADGGFGIYLGSLDSAEIKRLASADSAGAFLPPSWLMFVRQGTLLARRFDPTSGELNSDFVKIADGVGFDGNTYKGAFFVSTSGLVAYRSGEASRSQLIWFDRSGKAVGTIGAPDGNSLSDPELSPDGRRVAVDRTVDNNVDVWLSDAVRQTRFTFDAGVDNLPIWSPDGSRIVFRSTRKNAYDLYQKPSSGAGNETPVLESPLAKGATDLSPDGRFLMYYVANDPKTASDLWVRLMDQDQKPFVFLNTTAEERPAQFSPDGRWVAYQSNQSGSFEIYVRPFMSSAGGQWQISTSGGTQPRWQPGGKELYYVAPDGKLMAVPIAVNGVTLEPGAPVTLFQTRIVPRATSPYRQQYDVAPDGRFLINTAVDEANSAPIKLILNWNPSQK
jgi:Tol biopolymer transport system component